MFTAESEIKYLATKESLSLIPNKKRYSTFTEAWAVVVAQLVERSLLIPEVRGSNPVIGKNLFILNICLLSTVY